MVRLARSGMKTAVQWHVHEIEDSFRLNWETCKLEFMLIFYVKQDASKYGSWMGVCMCCLAISKDC